MQATENAYIFAGAIAFLPWILLVGGVVIAAVHLIEKFW